MAQEKAFNKAKQLISSAPVLAYYDLQKPVVLQTDASDNTDGGALLQSSNEGKLQPVVLQTDASDNTDGGALLQSSNEGKLQPVAFTYLSMNHMEQHYSQIQKECLAICNCFQTFDLWLYRKPDI